MQPEKVTDCKSDVGILSKRVREILKDRNTNAPRENKSQTPILRNREKGIDRDKER